MWAVALFSQFPVNCLVLGSIISALLSSALSSSTEFYQTLQFSRSLISTWNVYWNGPTVKDYQLERKEDVRDTVVQKQSLPNQPKVPIK